MYGKQRQNFLLEIKEHKTMKLYFARHGETDWNVAKRIQGTTDVELNEKGYDQARQLADNPQGKDILILSHGGVLWALLALQKDVAFEEMTSVIKIENAKAIEFDLEEIVRIRGKL